MRFRSWCASQVIGAILAIISASDSAAAESRVETIAGREAARIISAPSHVEVARLRQVEGWRRYVIVHTHPLLPRISRRLSSVVLESRTYAVTTATTDNGELVGRAKGCRIVPGVVARFFGPRDSQPVEIFICFACGQFGFSSNARPYRDGEFLELPSKISVADLDQGSGPNYSALLKLAAEMFPNDNELDELLRQRLRQERGP